MYTLFCSPVVYGYPMICIGHGCVIQLHGSIVLIRASIKPTLSHCSEYAWVSGTLLIVNICPAVIESNTHFHDVTCAWYTSSGGWWNFHQCTCFTLQNQITLCTVILDHVSSRPIIFKLIVWWNDTLLVPSHGCMLTHDLRAHYMVKFVVGWYYSMWDMLSPYFLEHLCKIHNALTVNLRFSMWQI